MDTIKCPNPQCGKELSIRFAECPFCGTELNTEAHKEKTRKADKQEETKIVQNTAGNQEEKMDTILAQLDSIRRMVKFFVILTVISMISGLILAIIAMS